VTNLHDGLPNAFFKRALSFEVANMKQHRASIFDDALPVDGRGKRSNETLLRIDERDRYLIEAARLYPGYRDREIARRLRTALSIYRGGRFDRDRACEVCPVQHRGKLTEVLWMILKVRDHVPSEMTIRRALGYS
jgi:hypothetical protein